MSTFNNVIHVPKPDRASYNPDRPLAKNELLLKQVEHFKKVEEGMPPEQRTGIPREKITTEAEAADYIRRITAALHPHTAPRVKVRKAT